MGKEKCFLLVDDDLDDRMIFSEALALVSPDIRLATASSGQEGIRLLASGLQFDCLFLDINMPLMNGVECLKELRQMAGQEHTPVIMYSTTISDLHAQICIGLGAIALFRKPNDFNQLCNEITAMLSLLEGQEV